MSTLETPKLPVWKPKFQRGKNFSMLVLASRGSGKSYLTKYLLEYHLRDKYDLFVVISDSDDELENYKEILPGRLFFNDFKPEIITNLIEMNKKRLQEGKPLLQVLFVFDDKISNKMKYNDELLQLFTRGRHVGISIVFISQSHVFASAAWRNNSDTIIVLKQNAKQARDAINDNILIGSLDAPDNVNEKKYYMNVMRNYINKEGDAIVLDFNEGAFNNLFQYRAPSVQQRPTKIIKKVSETKKEKPKALEIEDVQDKIDPVRLDNIPEESSKEPTSYHEQIVEISDSYDDSSDDLIFNFGF
jgi:hypothetical protein